MYIKSLELKNYRNYEDLAVSFSPGSNLFFGDNAQGKTNILESIYVSGTSKSHRGSKDKELIRFGEDESHIRLILNKRDVDHRIDLHLKKRKTKGIAIDGIPIRKSSDLLGMLNIIFFSPEDLSIIKNGPGERRRFLDMELCQLQKIYMFHLAQYNKVLKQRNQLLSQIAFQESLIDTLEVWDMQLVQYGSSMIEKRKEFIEELNKIICGIHHKLTGGREDIVVTYENQVEADEFAKQLAKRREMDLKYKNTGVGPHRDDIKFMVNGIDVRTYGSQGQQRTAALSLKLAEIELVKKKIGDKPILLLDDVLSELDSNRKAYLLEGIKEIQTFITCTGLEEFVNSQLSIDKMFYVKNGKIMKEGQEASHEH
ncbi:MAG: DNA replication/repair protein RecF [Lachnospiraceae bacterium]|nr:DNA replication/repair protein RecF [Lachnospiraceae bacterium]